MLPSTITARFAALESDRKTQDDTLQLVERFVTPYRGEFFRPMSSVNEVDWRRRTIFDSTAVWANDRLSSFIHSNLTSPAIKWFKLRFRDNDVNNNTEVRKWLDETEDGIWQTLRESDINGELGSTYKDLTSFATNVLLMEEVDDMAWQGLDFTSCPLMDSYFEMGAKSKVSRVYFRKRMTDLMLLERFPDIDESYLSGEGSEDATGDTDKKKEVILCMYYRAENKDADITKPLIPEARPVGYQWVMRDNSETLEEGGYYYMPGIVTRWALTAGSEYGHSPSMLALGDILQLNEFTAQISMAASKAIDPSLWTTTKGFIGNINLSPGSVNNVKQGPDGTTFGLMPEGSNFPAGDMDRERLVESILHVYAVDLLDLKESPQMTATEVQARLDRIMRQYAPVLGRLEPSLLTPIVENTFFSMLRLGQIKDIPEAAQGMEMDIEFTGPIPRAQRNEQQQGVQIHISEIMNAAELRPDVLDKIDWDAWVEESNKLSGSPARLLLDDDKVKEIRTKRAEAQKAAQETEAIRSGGEAMEAAGRGAKEAQGAQLQEVSSA